MVLTARERASALSLPPKLKLKIKTQFNRLLNGVPQDCNTHRITQIHLVRKNFWIENSNKNWLLHHEGPFSTTRQKEPLERMPHLFHGWLP